MGRGPWPGRGVGGEEPFPPPSLLWQVTIVRAAMASGRPPVTRRVAPSGPNVRAGEVGQSLKRFASLMREWFEMTIKCPRRRLVYVVAR